MLRLKITVYFMGFTTEFIFQCNKLQSMFVCSKINKIKNNKIMNSNRIEGVNQKQVLHFDFSHTQIVYLFFVRVFGG